MDSGGLRGEPLSGASELNWVFLVELLVSGVLTLFFLFYFNRLLATLLSYGLRAYTWHRYKAYVDIQSLQVSLLGGRIFFKGIRYHGHNQTILIHGGHLTWRYWLRKVKDAHIFSVEGQGRKFGADLRSSRRPAQSKDKNSNADETGGGKGHANLPCRIHAKISGFQAFLYNRSPAYDAVVESFMGKSSGLEAPSISSQGPHDGDNLPRSDLEKGKRASFSFSKWYQTLMPPSGQSQACHDVPFWLRTLPLSIECKKGAVVVGNEFTQCIMTARFSISRGAFDAASSNPSDLYKLLLSFSFSDVVTQLSPNTDFKPHQSATERGLQNGTAHGAPDTQASNKKRRKHISAKFRKPFSNILPPWFRSSVESFSPLFGNFRAEEQSNLPPDDVPGFSKWQGLTRYLDENQRNEHDEWEGIEYARSSTIADCPSISISYYWDIPGIVVNPSKESGPFEGEPFSPTEGSLPPDYGLDIHIHGGIINYGPWADRQRVNLQSVFFPTVYTEAKPANPPQPGDKRVYTEFKFFLSAEEDVVLRVPMREASKDWKWKGRAEAVAGQAKAGADKEKGEIRSRNRKRPMWLRKRDKHAVGPNVRPFAWLDIKVASNASVSYSMSMMANTEGYQNHLDIDLPSTELSSSVNHGLLWRSKRFSANCDLSNPCEWNALRVWSFDLCCSSLELFLLRDHMFLLTDLITDWSSGSGPDFFTFVPFHYILDMNLERAKLFINVNDSNIVNNPSDFEDNNFLVLFFETLHGRVDIPLTSLLPPRRQVSFHAAGPNAGLELCLPTKNTLKTYLKSKDIAQLGKFELDGTYDFCTENSPSLTDVLCLDISGSDVSLCLYGFIVHHFMKIKDNYFGDDIHFKTLEELQGHPHSDIRATGAPEGGEGPTKTNDLDVILTVSVQEGAVLVPCNIYSTESHIKVRVPSAAVDLRISNYYMDLMVDFYPLSISLERGFSKDIAKSSSNAELFVAKVNICGHRLFGLPPSEPTYDCIWDFQIGNISGEISVDFFERALAAIRAFTYSLDDDENALPLTAPPILHDVTFLRVRTGLANIWLLMDQEAWHLSAQSVSLDFNDWAGVEFSSRLKILIPELLLACVDIRSAFRNRDRTKEGNKVAPLASVQSTIEIDVLGRKREFNKQRRNQQEHIKEHDRRTHRVAFLLLEDASDSVLQDPKERLNIQPPAMPFPFVPRPVKRSDTATQTLNSKTSSETASQFRGSISSSLRSAAASARKGSRLAVPRRLFANARKTGTIDSNGRSSSPFDSFNSRRSSPRSSHHSRSRYIAQLPFNGKEVKGRDVSSSSITFASPLVTPYFYTSSLRSRIDLVPLKAKLGYKPEPVKGVQTIDSPSSRTFDENVSRKSILLTSDYGVQAYCSSLAVRSIGDLLGALQPKDPENLLDSFQERVIEEVMTGQEENQIKSECTELSVKLPSVRLTLDHSNSLPLEADYIAIDRYDLFADGLAVNARTEGGSDDIIHPKVVLHATVDEMKFSVQDKSADSGEATSAVDLFISRALVGFLSTSDRSVILDFSNWCFKVQSQKVDYIFSLIHRLILLIDDTIASIDALSAGEQRRLSYLVHYLTVFAKDIPDPPFLTRPSYALRADTGHLRTQDSWKILSRLRYVFQVLPDGRKRELALQCAEALPPSPQNAASIVISSWDQWRSWDLAHVKKSVVMKRLYGPTEEDDENLRGKSPLPLNASIRLANIEVALALDSELKMLSLDTITVALAVHPAQAPSGLMLKDMNHFHQFITLQIYAGPLDIYLNWDLVRALEPLMMSLTNSAGNETRKHRTSSTNDDYPRVKKHKAVAKYRADIIIITETIGIVFDSLSFRQSVITRELNSAIYWADGSLLSTSLSANAARFQANSGNRPLISFEILGGRLHIDHNHGMATEHRLPQWRISGASKETFLAAEEEAMTMIEVVNSFIRNELVYVQEFRKRYQGGIRSSASENVIGSPTVLPNIILLLESGTYIIDIALVHSLAYAIKGDRGRLIVRPEARRSETLRIGYEHGNQAHELYSKRHDPPEIISVLTLPPFSGESDLSRRDSDVIVTLVVAIERIKLDGSAVYAIISTFSLPQIVHAFEEVSGEVSVTSSELAKTRSKKPGGSGSQVIAGKQQIYYTVRGAFEGLHIFASAPANLPGSSATRLDFEISGLQTKVTNTPGHDRAPLPLPEVHFMLRHLSLDLKLSRAETFRHCGRVSFGFRLVCSSYRDESRKNVRDYKFNGSRLTMNVEAETAASIVNLVNHLQERLSGLNITSQRTYLRRFRRPGRPKRSESTPNSELGKVQSEKNQRSWLDSSYSIDLADTQLRWIVGTSIPENDDLEPQDLVLLLRRVNLTSTQEHRARFGIDNLKLQMVLPQHRDRMSSANFAHLPQVVFNVSHASTEQHRSLSFQAAGKFLELQLESNFILPAKALQRSIEIAGTKFRASSAFWRTKMATASAPKANLFGTKRLISLLVDADFAGATVNMQPAKGVSGNKTPLEAYGTYGASVQSAQSEKAGETLSQSTTMRSPGLALKLEFRNEEDEPSLKAEVKVKSSSNTLHPNFVPLLVDLSNSIKIVMQDTDRTVDASDQKNDPKLIEDGLAPAAEAEGILRKTRFNFGLRICKQEFSLSCQPMARVIATAQVQDIYVTFNTVNLTKHGHFFAASAIFDKLSTSIQHMYSKESTFSFDVESIVLSIMNRRHLSGANGLSAMLKINPVRTQINARQMQHFLIFREIWVPPELRGPAKLVVGPEAENEEYLVQRYRQVATAAAFTWDMAIAIPNVEVVLELGQAIGRAVLTISNLWASSEKASDWEQNLCVGVGTVLIRSTGRMSGFIELEGFRVRTAIAWPQDSTAYRQTPVIQASVGLNRFRTKTAFDYQGLAVGDVASFHFLMYNVRHPERPDRLAAMLEGEKVCFFCTPMSAAQAATLYQAFQRLLQENRSAYAQSVAELGTSVGRRSARESDKSETLADAKEDQESVNTPVFLHTKVLVTLRSLNIGAFPGTFLDNQALVMEASNTQVRFVAAMENAKVHSGLGMTLGQLRIALAPLTPLEKSKSLEDLKVDEVIDRATSSRSGTILRVPKAIANMQTWQVPGSYQIEYVFQSSFEGKIDVGWNYSRIGFIRGMWNNHSRALSARLGKPLPESAVRITTQKPDGDESSSVPGEQEKITAVVTMPQSRYDYTALEPPVIETPQLRDMGEATPPLEWIGLHRERMPNITHQIVIVPLIELAKEVEDAYVRILGSS